LLALLRGALLLYQFVMQQQNRTRRRVLFQMYLEPALAKRLKKRARLEALAMSAWVRQVITYALDKPSRRELDLPSSREARQQSPANQA
jgi:hypothetical protein